MPRIPNALLDEITSAAPLAAVLQARGVEGRQRGAEWVCCCPLPEHADRTPSFHARAAVGHCHGCGWSGSVFQLVQALDGCGFVDAVASVAEVGGVDFDAAKWRPPVRRNAAPASCPLDPAADAAALSAQVVAFYHARLLRSGSAGWRYLESRGLADAALVRHFQVGFAERGVLGKLLPDKQRAAGKQLREKLESLDWFKAGSGHETFAGRVVVPLLDASGAVAGCYGRALRPLKNGSVHRYRAGDQRPLFNAAALVGAPRVIICESIFDVFSVHRAGFSAVTTAYGTKGWEADWLTQLRDGGTQEIAIAFDGDDAGSAGADALAEAIIAAGMTALRAPLPAGQDCNAVLCAEGAPALADILRTATWLGGAPRAESAQPIFPSVAARSASSVALEQTGADEWQADCAGRNYRVRGLTKNTAPELLRVQLRLTWGDRQHTDSVNLASDRARTQFTTRAAQVCGLDAGVVRGDLARLLGALEQVQDDLIAAAQRGPALPDPLAGVDAATQRAARELLQSPDMLARITDDLTACGLLGETLNKQAAYLVAVSRLLPKPLALIVQSSSAGGKSSLIDTVLDCLPDVAKRQFTALSDNALYYAGDTLRHTVLSVAESVGAEGAGYTLKLLLSEGRASKMVTVKDPQTGVLESREFVVDGPMALLMTTTALRIDDELQSRCLVVAVDESPAHSAAIYAAQRAAWDITASDGGRAREAILATHQAAQALLRPVRVHMPFVHDLSFPTGAPRLRRAHQQYLTLIATIALLQQYQRAHHTWTDPRTGATDAYIEATPADVRAANAIAAHVFGIGLDELPAPTRRFAQALDGLVQTLAEERAQAWSAVTWTTRDVLERLDYAKTQVSAHLRLLREHELILGARDPRSQVWTYTLPYRLHGAVATIALQDVTGMDGQPVARVVDGNAERKSGETSTYDAGIPADSGGIPAAFRQDSGAIPAAFRQAKIANGSQKTDDSPISENSPKNAYRGSSHPQKCVVAGSGNAVAPVNVPMHLYVGDVLEAARQASLHGVQPFPWRAAAPRLAPAQVLP